MDPFDNHAYFGLATLDERDGRIDEAIREYRTGLQTDPRNATALAAIRRLVEQRQIRMPLPIPLRSDTVRERQVQAERRLLAALCQGSLSQRVRKDVQRCLAARRFANPEHDVIFQALSTLPTSEPTRAREILKRCASRGSAFPISTSNRFSPPCRHRKLRFLALLALLT